MSQRVDVAVDGKNVNTYQRSDNPLLIARVTKFMQSATTVQIKRSVAPAPGPVPTPPPPHTLQSICRNIGFGTDHILQMQLLPLHWSWAITADEGYIGTLANGYVDEAQDYKPLADIVKAGRDQHRTLYAWGNQSQIGVQKIKDIVTRFSLDGYILQAENDGEMSDVGLSRSGTLMAGSPLDTGKVLLVGNPTGWTDAQRTKATLAITADKLAVTAEVYTNLMPWVHCDNYNALGVPVASFTLGLYDGKSENPQYGNYTTTPEYRGHCSAATWPSVCAYLSKGSGTRDEDVRALP